ncbi:hypothetical protein [Mixta theicola]|uniref:hypothetical protein n=1 Tax=Mixta theicola TaxID=1458355 RepID=UPI0013FD2EAF|nr:hypothetical protein [Mixta theicola]
MTYLFRICFTIRDDDASHYDNRDRDAIPARDREQLYNRLAYSQWPEQKRFLSLSA